MNTPDRLTVLGGNIRRPNARQYIRIERGLLTHPKLGPLACPPFFTQASTTSPLPSTVAGVLRGEGMTVFTVRLHRVPGRTTDPAQYVFPISDSLKMIRVNAPDIAAQVIQHKPGRDGSIRGHVGQTVAEVERHRCPANTGIPTGPLGAGPIPASSGGISNDAVQKPLRQAARAHAAKITNVVTDQNYSTRGIPCI